jgi:hypothetical protein
MYRYSCVVAVGLIAYTGWVLQQSAGNSLRPVSADDLTTAFGGNHCAGGGINYPPCHGPAICQPGPSGTFQLRVPTQMGCICAPVDVGKDGCCGGPVVICYYTQTCLSQDPWGGCQQCGDGSPGPGVLKMCEACGEPCSHL